MIWRITPPDLALDREEVEPKSLEPGGPSEMKFQTLDVGDHVGAVVVWADSQIMADARAQLIVSSVMARPRDQGVIVQDVKAPKVVDYLALDRKVQEAADVPPLSDVCRELIHAIDVLEARVDNLVGHVAELKGRARCD